MSRPSRAAFSLAGLLIASLCLPLAAQQKGEIIMSARPLTQAMLAAGGPQVALVFDDLNTTQSSMEWAKRAAAEYVTSAPAGTRWAVITTSGAVQQPFTSDAAAVKAVLTKLSSHEELGSKAASQITGLTEQMHGGGNADENLQTQSAHSLDELGAALSYAAAQPGGPTLVVLASNGFPTDFPANGTNLNDQMERLNAAARSTGLTVNSVDPASIDPSLSSSQWQLEEVIMSGLAQATGGKLVDNRNALAHAYADLAEDPAQMKMQAKFRGALDGSQTYKELPMEIIPQKWQPRKGEATGSRLVVLISPKGLKFEDVHGSHRQHLRIGAVMTNAQGTWVAGREGDILLDVSNSTLQKLVKDNIQAAIDLPAPPGAYHVVIVAQELRTGDTTAIAGNLTIQ